MDKVILINKEKGITSRDVVNIISRKLNTKKVGHFGTLDPLATGLLVIGTGTLTKIGNLFTNETKEYEVEVLLGTSTNTYDITGKVLEEKDIDITEEQLKELLFSFKGKYDQEVPIYSAVKVNGKKLYEYARNGEEVLLPKKEVEIIDIAFGELYEENYKKYFSFKVLVSKGTYIRSLINDLSKKINIPMCMSNLKRTKCGNFSLDDANTLDDIENDTFKTLDITEVLDIEVRKIPETLEKLILHGTQIDIKEEKMILWTKNNEYISLYGPYKNKMKPYLTFKKDIK